QERGVLRDVRAEVLLDAYHARDRALARPARATAEGKARGRGGRLGLNRKLVRGSGAVRATKSQPDRTARGHRKRRSLRETSSCGDGILAQHRSGSGIDRFEYDRCVGGDRRRGQTKPRFEQRAGGGG